MLKKNRVWLIRVVFLLFLAWNLILSFEVCRLYNIVAINTATITLLTDASQSLVEYMQAINALFQRFFTQSKEIYL